MVTFSSPMIDRIINNIRWLMEAHVLSDPLADSVQCTRSLRITVRCITSNCSLSFLLSWENQRTHCCSFCNVIVSPFCPFCCLCCLVVPVSIPAGISCMAVRVVGVQLCSCGHFSLCLWGCPNRNIVDLTARLFLLPFLLPVLPGGFCCRHQSIPACILW